MSALLSVISNRLITHYEYLNLNMNDSLKGSFFLGYHNTYFCIYRFLNQFELDFPDEMIETSTKISTSKFIKEFIGERERREFRMPCNMYSL